MKQFVFMILGDAYIPSQHFCCFEPGCFISRVETVRDFDEAKRAVVLWQEEGVGVIECCGAFSPIMVEELRQLTSYSIPISACVHFDFQNQVFEEFFQATKTEEKYKGDYMMMMMDTGYKPESDCAVFKTNKGNTRIETVRNFEEAKNRAKNFVKEGVGLVECCGSFSKERVKELIETAGGSLPMGYLHTEPASLPLLEAFFYEPSQ